MRNFKYIVRDRNTYKKVNYAVKCGEKHDNKDLIIVPWTGLVDVTGKEIYEYDIVQLRFPNGSSPIFKNFLIVYDQYECYYGINTLSMYHDIGGNRGNSEYKLTQPKIKKNKLSILGNFFENDELIPDEERIGDWDSQKKEWDVTYLNYSIDYIRHLVFDELTDDEMNSIDKKF